MRRVDVRLVTYADCLPGGDPDSAFLLRALHEIGVATDVRAWDDAATDWSEAALTVIRSTWDYHERHSAFLEWAERTDRVTHLQNHLALLRWNSHKAYLLDLEHAGLPTVPSALLGQGQRGDTSALLAGVDWPEIVMKPAVSLDGHRVVRMSKASPEAEAALERLLDEGDVIVQPFVPAITRAGEVSLIFVDGVFQHAVRKRPAAGEFRVQERLGGTTVPTRASGPALDLGVRTIASLPVPPLYGRVDVIRTGGTFHITELELVEPSLFLVHSKATARRFAHAIAARLG